MRSISHAAACAGLCLFCAPCFAGGDAAGEDLFTAELGGELHLDYSAFDNDDRGPNNTDGLDARRARLEISGDFYGWGYSFEADFEGLQDDFSADVIEAKNFYVTREFGTSKLTIGQFIQNFSLDAKTSSNNGLLMERTMFGTTIAPLYRLGIGWIDARDHHTLGVGYYSLEQIDEWHTKGNALSARGTWTPLREDERVVHLGLSLAREWYDHPGVDGASALRVRPRPAGAQSDNSRAMLTDFNTGRDVDADKYSLEFAATRGPLYVQSEYGGVRYDDGMQRNDLRSFYAAAGWLLTGETMPYDAKNGRFGKVKPQRKGGAWQLVLRYDRMTGRQHLDGQTDFLDASTEARSIGVNWYANANIRLMVDWIESHNRDRLADRTLDRTRALTTRFQFVF